MPEMILIMGGLYYKPCNLDSLEVTPDLLDSIGREIIRENGSWGRN